MDDSLIKNLPQYPEPEFKDEFARWIKATVSDLLPFGNTLTSVFSSFITPKLEQRREDFLRDVAYWIMIMSKKNEAYKPENLIRNETFTSSILSIVQIAIKTHNEEKLKSLRNALLNIVNSDNDYEIKKLVVLSEIENITELHLSLLKFIWEKSGGDKMYVKVTIPLTEAEMTGLSFQPVAYSLKHIFDEYSKMQKVINSNPYLFNKLINDLKFRELIEIKEIENDNRDKVSITLIGNDLIHLIQDPKLE